MSGRRAISIGVSAAIIFFIWWTIDFAEILRVLKTVNLWWLSLAVLLTVATLGITAWRFDYMVLKRTGHSDFPESCRLILAASAMNLVLPAKMGDIAKGVFIKDRPGIGNTSALALVILEKANDVLALLVWCMLGLLVFPEGRSGVSVFAFVVGVALVVGGLMVCSTRCAGVAFSVFRKAPRVIARKVARFEATWLEMHEDINLKTRTFVLALSVLLWLVHLLQIWFFILALNVTGVPFTTSLGLSALAIFAGLLPLTFMGVGTRDAALVYFYSPALMAAPAAAALGVLTLLRYLVPGVAGLPYLHRYVGLLQRAETSEA